MDIGGVAQGLGGFLGGLFGHPEKAYDKSKKEYEQWIEKARQTQQPYSEAGKTALSDYQNWLNGQKDPSGFINGLMGKYNESPYAHYMQQQAMNAGTNAASASGLIGSTPFAQQLQQNAAGIASGDMNNWLQNVLGINTQYGEGEKNLVSGGQNSANALTNLFNEAGKNMSEQTYNREATKNNNFWNTIGHGLNTIGSFFS